MASRPDGVSAEGRVRPPEEYRIAKGKSGNYKGRPQGSVSLKALARGVAGTKHSAVIDGEPQRRTLLELLVLKTRSMAFGGNAGAAAVMRDLLNVMAEPEPEGGGFLLAPAELMPDEWIAEAEARNATAAEPGTEVNVETEEFLKAVRGEPSPLGEALLSFHKKYGPLGLR
ncbi:DUF5681 domain-containing protein [Bradyrhizobium sp.]|jgi:hypothetical protein|uniref:DUF5681 domain-containing protein n=1 Tax=Bradyrhizobium sp. TaxID=376 RepID=UPI002E00AB1A|nr:DUF5681 domain-containing protein [Bradyrhizobium sp.]